MRKSVCIIPARGGSKGIPKKNIKNLGDYPLIAYSIAASKLSKHIRNTIVTTDCKEIANIAKHYGADVPYLRPSDLAKDDSTDLEFFNYHLDYLKKNNLEIPDFFVHLRPTTPFREISIIDDAISLFVIDKQATSLRSAYFTHLTPYKMFKKEGNYMRPFLTSKLAKEFYNLPRQAFEDAYIPNGYIDIVKSEVFLTSNMLHGENIYLYETDNVADIDTQEDFLFAEKMLLVQDKFEEIFKYLEGIK